MSKAQKKTLQLEHQFRDGTLGWFLVRAGWIPVEQVNCPNGKKHHKDPNNKCDRCHQIVHPLWRFQDIGVELTGWEARRVELARIHNEFKAKAKGVSA
jgi:hypothetical protein